MSRNSTVGRVATTRPDHRRGMTKSEIRAERRGRSERRKRRRRSIFVGLGSVFAVFIIIALIFQQGIFSHNRTLGGERGGYNAGGPVSEDPDDGRTHVLDGVVPETEYSTTPATSGPHWNTLGNQATNFETAPTGWGPYDRFLPDQVLVHNLEHGGIGMHYDPTKCSEAECNAISEELQRIAKEWNGDTRGYIGFIISPYPNMDSTITLTAWRHHLSLDEIDEPLMREFIDAYLDRGYEPIEAGMTSGN